MPKLMVKINENGAENWEVKNTYKELTEKLLEGKPFKIMRSDGSQEMVINPAYIVYAIDDIKEPTMVAHKEQE